ncbi:MAG: hypothetical protein HYS24_05490 [Ignavibacteriales bacterium]|nr:hypothetical protein [Ignavibacteriales bacterium]
MTKLSKEESKGLPKGKIISKYILSLLLISVNVPAQTLLNNFGISQEIVTYPGFTKFTFIDYNDDGIDDIILFGSQQKSFVLHKGLAEGSFGAGERKFFFFPIDDFKWIKTSPKGENFYLFVSRNKRMAGLVSFNKTNNLQLIDKIEFNSYPTSFEIVDLDNNSENEAIISGTNFKGFKILSLKGNKIIEESSYDKNIFREIIPLDFNQDGFTDLIGIDILNNSLKFMESYPDYAFNESRDISFNKTLYSFKKVHYNNDDFIDLAVADGDGLKIMLGDSVYSFSQTLKFNFDFIPSIFEIEDFNKNNFKDIAAINFDTEQAYIKLNDIKYLVINYEIEGITDLKYLKNKYANSVLILSKNGYLKQLGALKDWRNSFNYSIGGIPKKIYLKKSGNKLESQIIISDIENNFATILTLDKKGNFSNQNVEKFVNDFNQISISPVSNMLAAFTKYERLIEIRSAERKPKTKNQNFIYAANPVEEILIDSTDNFYTLQKSNAGLYYTKMEFDKDQYKNRFSTFIDTSVVEQILNSANDMFYWQNVSGSLSLKNYRNKNYRTIISKKINQTDKPKVTILDRSRKNSQESILSILHFSDYELIILYDGKTTKQIRTKNILFKALFDESNYWYYQDKRKNYILYFKKENKVQKFKLDFNTDSVSRLADYLTPKIIDYSIENFEGQLYLIYTATDKSIKFQKI